MQKLNLTLILMLTSIVFSYGQVIESDTAKGSTGVMDAIRPPVDGTYEKVHIQEFTPIPLTYVREADVYWSKLIWRVIDLRKKFNFPFYFPTEKQGNWKSLMQAILDAVDSTEANPNPLRIYTDEYVNVPYSITELKNTLGETRVIEIVNEWGEPIGDSTIFIPYGAKDVYQYVIKEQWKMDKQRSIVYPQIISISPMFWVERMDGGGDFGDDGGGVDIFADDVGMEEEDAMPAITTRRWRIFGWIWYPEVRQTLVTTEVFKPGNNAQRRNYDDLLLQRRFDSFIKAEENVHNDREINMYIVNGFDQALEAERIKENLRTREHDMWEF